MLLQLVPTLISWVVVPTPLQYHATSHICQRPVARHARPVACAEGNENKGSLGRPLNPYVEALQNMSAPELVKRFAETAPPEVQQAVRATVISLMGKPSATPIRHECNDNRDKRGLPDVLHADDGVYVP